MVFKFESRAEATALLRRRSRDAAVALLNKEFTAQRWTLRKELKLSVRPLVTLRYFRRAVLSTAGLGTGMQTGALFLFPHCARLATDWRNLGPASATTRALADRWLAKGAPAKDAGRPAGGDAGPGASEAPAARAAPASSFLGGLRRGAGGVSLGAARGGEADAARAAASFRARSRDGRAALALRAAVPGFFSGAGSAVGELVPFFLARAARRAGADPFAVIEEEEAAADDGAPARRPRLPLLAARTRARLCGNQIYGAFVRVDLHAIDATPPRWRDRLEAALADGAFWKIFVLAALPNPFFDLCGLVCGSLDVSLGTYFGACFAAKALVRTPLQTCAVALAVHRVGGAPAPPRALARVARGAFLALSSLLFACFLVSALEQMAQQRAIAELRADYDSILLAGEDA
ncbi:unnamed protein product [Pelagomonas calceolata]|uniref:Uncharacterized protein n=1 Tax=Pelagomonas calceolata TaxID=35677 RepID=A0A8J2X225_9STRA|nr:unnamed protein product [Pelagomonas calceolata]